MNNQTLQKVFKIPELITSAELTGQDIICIKEYRFIHEDTVIKEHAYNKWKLLTLSAWKNSINAATIVGIGMLISSQAEILRTRNLYILYKTYMFEKTNTKA